MSTPFGMKLWEKNRKMRTISDAMQKSVPLAQHKEKNKKKKKKPEKRGKKEKEKTDHVAHVLGLAHVQRTSLRRNAEAVGAVRASPLHAAYH